jgi:hypothetical protein
MPYVTTVAATGSGSRPSRTATKIDGFAQLPFGWHYGSGGPISPNVIAQARKLHSALLFHGFTRTDAFAGVGGEVLLTAYHRGHYLALTIDPDFRVTLNHELDGNDQEYLERRSEAEIVARVRAIASGIWSTFVSSTSVILTTPPGSSVTWNLKNRPMAAECRSSNWNAPALQAAG